MIEKKGMRVTSPQAYRVRSNHYQKNAEGEAFISFRTKHLLGDLMKIRIRMFSDYICPFCYLGKAIIDKLKNRFDIELEHVGLEIHPETPICGVDLRKYISETNEMYENLRRRGRDYGLNFCDVRILPNSKKALILGEYLRRIGKNEEFTDAIFEAYFEDCLDIGKEEIIIALAKKIGLTKHDIENALADPLLQKIYANNCIEAREHDVTGVPTFVINDEYTIVGAQNEQTFIELFEKIEKETMYRPNDETAPYIKKDAKKC